MMQFKHIRTQIAIVFLSLVLLIQLLGLIPMDFTIDKHAKEAADKQMLLGERVFINLLQHDTQNLKQGAMLLAADYGFREAVATEDDATLQSSLQNHQQRIQAEVAYFYSTQSSKLTGTIAINPQEQQAIEELVKQQQIGKLQFLTLNQTPYQLVAVPVKAPALIGWVVLGFKIDQRLATKLKTLSNLDISFIQKQGRHWKMVASSLNPNVRNKLINALAKTHTQHYRLKTMAFDDEVYELKTRILHQDKENALIAVMQDSVTENIKQFDELKWAMVGLTILGLVIFASVIVYVSKIITSPLTELLDSAKEMAKGNYLRKIKMLRNDELGQLGLAFNEMREAIAEREQKVHELAFGDELTGLANRLAFMQALNQAIQTHEKTQSSLSVVVLNIDRFKQINITLGRDFGDDVLRYLGKTLNKLKYNREDVVARLDADEFAVILHHADQEKATNFASEVSRIFEMPVEVDEQVIDIRMGIGISLYPTHGQTEETLLHQAETAQQTSKQKKSGWIVYNTALEIDQSDKLIMITELKEAIKHNQLLMYLQPKVNTKTKALVGAEALIRWIHPTKGMMFPDQFIPFAEHTGTISHITHWILEQACKVILEFRQQQIDLSISVNLSTRDLNNLDLPNQIQSLLDDYGLNSAAIHLEITESALMDDPLRAGGVVRKLSELGIHISIDDFGTGYSSLAYLRELPVNELKIDKSFVMQMDNNPSDKAIVRSTIDLGHNLGLNVVAEGIETEETINQLAELGCDEGQGYYISKPMPVRDFGVWLERWQNQISQIDYNLDEKETGIEFIADDIKPEMQIASIDDSNQKEIVNQNS